MMDERSSDRNGALIERFFRYVKIDTQSAEDAETQPSTEKQRDLARLLFSELQAFGLKAEYDEAHGYVYAVLPGEAPALGFIAHMDTSPAASGKNVRPRVEENYSGGDIVLKQGINSEKAILLSPVQFPGLLRHIGEDLIVTDGTTLLGADDKAGVSEIMTFCEYVMAHPEKKHGRICVGFTPDEEIGRGADLFDVAGFGADFAYTVDGGIANEIEFENFNAASALVKVNGFSIHPGSAKNKMRNASLMAMEFHSMLPENERPEYTEGYEGFYHLNRIEGQEQNALLHYIIRDHDRAKFEQKKDRIRRIADYLNGKYGEGSFELTVKDSYYNMREEVEKKPEVVERAREAIRAAGMEPVSVPIRGGTDGARLTFMGLVCPNLGTGGRNYHGVYEYAVIQEMEAVVEILKNLILK